MNDLMIDIVNEIEVGYNMWWHDDRCDYEMRRYDAYEEEYGSKFNPKVEVPEFEGTPYVDDFLDWLNSVERIFEYYDVPKQKKVKLVAIKLRQHTYFWWKNLKKQRVRDGKGKIAIWDKIKKELTMKYLPNNYRQDI